MDWVIPTEQVLARMSMLEEQETLPRKTNPPRRREKITQRLLKFAQQFRHAD